jgi:hypothetical protein
MPNSGTGLVPGVVGGTLGGLKRKAGQAVDMLNTVGKPATAPATAPAPAPAAPKTVKEKAVEWIRDNPTHPHVPEIKKRLGIP